MSGSSLRAVLRLAWRSLRRHPVRTAFLVLVMALPVAAAVATATYMRTATSTPEEYATARMGNADALIETWSPGPRVAAWIDGWVSDLDGVAVDRVTSLWIPVVGDELRPQYAEVTDLDPTSPIAGPQVVMQGGSAPPTEGTVVVGGRELGKLPSGDTVDIGGRSFEVVGYAVDPTQIHHDLVVMHQQDLATLVALPDLTPEQHAGVAWLLAGPVDSDDLEALSAEFAMALPTLVAPASGMAQPPELAVLDYALYATLDRDAVDALLALGPVPTDVLWDAAYGSMEEPPLGLDFSAELREWTLDGPQFFQVTERPDVVGGLIAALLLVEVVFIAGAALMTGLRRRLRELGLFGAGGASDGQMRGVVLGEALLLGIVAAVLGAVAGWAVVSLGTGVIQRFTDRLITEVLFVPSDVIWPIVLTLGAALVAGWLPARLAARAPITAALAGRLPVPPPRRSFAAAALLVSGFGLLLVAAVREVFSRTAAVSRGVGIALAVLGAAALAVPIVARLGNVADRLRPVPRLVVRQAARHRTRTAAAIAALTVVFVVPATIATALATEDARDLIFWNRPADNLVAMPAGDALGPMADSAASASAVEAVLPSARRFEIDELEDQALTNAARFEEPEGPPVGTRDDALVEALGGDVATLEPGDVVVLGTADRIIEVAIGESTIDAQMLDIPLVRGVPTLLIPAARAAELGLEAAGTATVWVNPEPLTADQLDRLDGVEGIVVPSVQILTSTEGQLLAIGISIVVALLISALVLGLSASESRQDVLVVVAVGGEPSIRRRLLGVEAGYYAAVAAGLAIPVGLLLMRASTSRNGLEVGPYGVWESSSIAIPWLALAVLAFVVPLVMAAIVALVARSAPATAPRRIG